MDNIQNGDEISFSLFYQLTHKGIFSFIYSYVGNWHTAEDELLSLKASAESTIESLKTAVESAIQGIVSEFNLEEIKDILKDIGKDLADVENAEEKIKDEFKAKFEDGDNFKDFVGHNKDLWNRTENAA